MDHLAYLQEVCEDGAVQAASSPEEAAKVISYHGFDSFQGLYYDLAKMIVCHEKGAPFQIRPHSLVKALDRLDQRLDCADFVIPALIFILRRFHSTPYLSPDEEDRIHKSLINFKYWLDEPGDIKACFFTENHQILFHSAEYLAGQLYPDDVFPNNGMTGKQHREHAAPFLRRWLSWRLRFGFGEWLTQGYYMDDILGLVNLMLFAEEEDIRVRSRMVVDLLIYDLALHGFHGHLPTTHGRVYTDFIIEPDHEDCSHLFRFLFGEGCREGLCGAAVMLAAAEYCCPPAILAAYQNHGIQTVRERMSMEASDAAGFGIDPKDFDNIMFFWGMQTYSDRVCIDQSLKVFPTWNWMTNRVKAYKERYDMCDAAGVPCPDAPDFTAMTRVDIETRRTPDYILSCAQDFRKGRMGYQQHPWTASLGGRALIFTTSPASLEYANRPNRWAGNLVLPKAVQHQNVLLCIYRNSPDFVDYLYSHLYFPKHEMDEVIENGQTIFGRKGNAYIAVSSVSPGYWEPKDPALFRHVYGEQADEYFSKADDYEYIVQGHANVWAVEMGSKDENGSFAQFVERFSENAIQGDTHAFVYHSPSLGEVTCGWSKELTVNGVSVNVHPDMRYDTDSCHAPFDASHMTIASGGHQSEYHFAKNTARHS